MLPRVTGGPAEESDVDVYMNEKSFSAAMAEKNETYTFEYE